jgi:pimeloyl-ACP methyl ester carboxylesterase
VDADRECATRRNRAVAAHAAVANAVAPLIDPAGTVIVGHSFGGAIAVLLVGRPGVVGVVRLGIKVAWTGEELARGRRARPAHATDRADPRGGRRTAPAAVGPAGASRRWFHAVPAAAPSPAAGHGRPASSPIGQVNAAIQDDEASGDDGYELAVGPFLINGPL